jgi:GT2 family glycosyltransferase
MFDIITVIHNDTNELLAERLYKDLRSHEDESLFNFYVHSNKNINIGFGKGCNAGAFRSGASNPYIGFLNPDVKVSGPFLIEVVQKFSEPDVVITGNSFNKPRNELDAWGVQNWVCGATLFVKRDWFTSVGGFDPEYEWSFEETDLIRQAEQSGLICSPIETPHLAHTSPSNDSWEDANYKDYHFRAGAQYFYGKWR